MKATIMIARFPGSNQEHPESTDLYVDLLRRADKDPRVDQVLLWKMADTPITMSRNRCVREAIQAGVDFLFMIDSDMGRMGGQKPFYDVAMDFLFRRETPAIIASPYCGPPPQSCVYVFAWHNHQNPEMHVGEDFHLRMFDRHEVANRAGIEEVAALPTGLIAIDMRLFTGFISPKTGQKTQLPPPWFEYEWTDKFQTHKASTEDVYFSRNASLLGCPNYVAWDCWSTHHKEAAVTKPINMTVADVSKEYFDAAARPSDTLLMLPPKRA